MSPERYPRASRLKEYAAEEIDQFQRGEIPCLSTIAELQERFGYRSSEISNVTTILKRAGLRQARIQIIKEAAEDARRMGIEPPSFPRGTERTAALVEIVQEEIARAESGEIERVSTQEELASMFGYGDKGNVNRYLERAGIRTKRNTAKNELARVKQEAESIIPSGEWAWMLGVLAEGGAVRTDHGIISVTTQEGDPFLEVFKNRGGQLLNIGADIIPGRRASTPNPERIVKFASKHFTELIGDMRTSRWVSTICERHSWVRENNEYIWKFLEGYFERNGSALMQKANKRGRRGIIFHTNSVINANFLTELLVLAGVQNPKMSPSKQAIEGIDGVAVYNLQDITLVASHIHVMDPEKEARLEHFRSVSAPEYKSMPTDEEVIREWIRLNQLFGHTPITSEIAELKSKGETKFSPAVYGSRFSNQRGKERFKEARKNLEEIVFGREVNHFLMQYEDKTGIQVRYTSKIH